MVVAITLFRNGSLAIQTCVDGTFYDSCSLRKPYYCEEGVLVEKVSLCGCPNFFTERSGVCFSVYQTNSKNVNLDYILRGENNSIEYLVYGGVVDYLSALPKYINYEENETAFRGDFKIRNLDEGVQREFLLPLVTEIQNSAETEEDAVRIAISLVQRIPYNDSSDSFVFVLGKVNYSQYPYEILYSMKAICEEKAGLLAFLLREMGYGVALFYYPEENHEALGIKCPSENSLMESGYCFIETTGTSILSNSVEYYLDEGELIQLTSEPEIIVLAEGKSLGKMYEYRDAKKIIRINKAIEEKGRLNYFQHRTLEKLKEKYDLDGFYG